MGFKKWLEHEGGLRDAASGRYPAAAGCANYPAQYFAAVGGLKGCNGKPIKKKRKKD